ncbi:MAG: hypothetical protein KatS3mg115_2586 [Candidatus Poribacteria bacterium]|nr:MAG: hypothetical protein KatS3mg115_2586 [Candidatus Poribacteria bacterium]
MSRPDSKQIAAVFESAGVPLDTAAAERFAEYLRELLHWNRRMNLVGEREPDRIVRRHLLDSALGAFYLPLRAGDQIADLGSGAGLPGIPLAILCPAVTVYLYEARTKKAGFLAAVKAKLGLENAVVMPERFETTPKPGEPPAFDGVVSRYTAATDRLVRLARPRLRPGGWLFAYKRDTPEERRLFEALRASPGVSQARWIADDRAVPGRCFLLLYLEK